MEQPKPLIRIRQFSISGLTILAVVLILAGWLLNTPPGLSGKADAVGYAVCHRIDLRSFHIGDRPLPLCARCTGMYLGAVVGLLYQTITARRKAGMPPRSVLAGLGLLVLLFGVDGFNSYLRLFLDHPLLYEPNNTLRLLTGTGMGIAIASVLFPAFNQSVWQVYDSRPPLPGLPALGLTLALGLGIDLLVLTENPFVLYPLALISAGGVLLLLTMVYSLIYLMVLRLENRFQSFPELFVPLCAGLGLGVLQIAVLDAVRYLLTGTWDGFHLG